MKVLLINQCFYPDVVSSAQHLTDLALELVHSGHKVTVLAGRRGYDDPNSRFPGKEIWEGISIIRIPSTGLGKSSRFSRAIDFGSFMLCCMLRMLFLRRFDAVVALTSPPLISFFAALFAFLKRERFYCWIMDLNPDEAIAAGWLRENSIMGKLLASMLMFSVKTAQKLIVLDRFMKERLLAKGVDERKIAIIPPWSHDQHAFFSPDGRTKFRADHGWTDKFIVMYSGNHSPCHPLDTLLQSAHLLSDRKDIRFAFIGGGSEFAKAKVFVSNHSLENVDFLSYQPINKLAQTLSSADLHVVVMGNLFTGIVHPCKIYNILTIGSPFLYIGPKESHIEDIASRLKGSKGVYSTRHGDIQSAVDAILKAQRDSQSTEGETFRMLATEFSKGNVMPYMIDAIECAPETSGKLKAFCELSDLRATK
jgi:colanic acid biosynthesis glycosyl transferase WcaI